MSYGVFSHHGIFTVNKLKPNGARGQRVSGHQSKVEAEAKAAELTATETKMFGGEQRVAGR